MQLASNFPPMILVVNSVPRRQLLWTPLYSNIFEYSNEEGNELGKLECPKCSHSLEALAYTHSAGQSNVVKGCENETPIPVCTTVFFISCPNQMYVMII